MEGYLDHLETTGSVGRHTKVWIRRFFTLNSTDQVLEVFKNETLQERIGKLQLHNAVVTSADEHGELLRDSNKETMVMSRRFIFRITEGNSKKDHYFCADIRDLDAPALPTYKLISFTREYLQQWLSALRAAVSTGDIDHFPAVQMTKGELNAHIEAFMNHLHLSARITNRIHDHGKVFYEIIVKAWVLKRELIEADEMHGNYRNNGHESVSKDDLSWQVLEYSCAWKLLKSTAELRNFDGQLRLLFASDMQNITFPSRSIGQKLQQLHLNQSETERQQRLQAYDAYLHSLLCLPAFSSFGSDASAMLDTFFDICPHLASFRKLEKESGLSMHLQDRQVVPWKHRERFERLYKMHLDVIEAQEKLARRAQTSHSGKGSSANRQHHHRSHRGYSAENNDMATRQATADDTHAAHPTKTNAVSKQTCLDESFQEHIARIGHRLVIQAFET